MRRRIDCNYIVFLRHVFDKSKAKEISSRKKKQFFSRDQAKRHLREQNAVAIANGRNGRNSGRGCFSNGLSMLDDLGNFNCNQVPSFVRTGK